MLSIRKEQPGDIDTIRDLTIRAFADSDFGHNGEAELIETIRSNCPDALSLVAVLDSKVVGHILFSPVVLHGDGNELTGMGLAPMAVSPEHQRTGLGSELVKAGLKQLADHLCSFCVVLGHPDFYPRFGFEPGSTYGVRHGFAAIPQEVFFIRWTSPEKGTPGGLASYCDAFGPQPDETSI